MKPLLRALTKRLIFLAASISLFHSKLLAADLFAEAHGPSEPYYPVSAFAQSMGFSFDVQQPVMLSAVHAEMGHSEPGSSFFAAVVKVDPVTRLPYGPVGLGNPFPAGDVLHYETFAMGSDPIVPVTIPFSYQLNPGTYGLVIGSGVFGTFATYAVSQGYTSVAESTGFSWYNSTPTSPWRHVGETTIGYSLEGTVIPEPTSGLLAMSAISAIILRRIMGRCFGRKRE